MIETRAKRFCETCGKQMQKRSKDSHDAYLTRRFCNHACRMASSPVKASSTIPLGKCERCGNKIPRREREHDKAYLKKRYCTHACAQASRIRDIRAKREEERRRAHIRVVVPAATEAEWLRLNNGPTICPPRYAAPVEHYVHVGIPRAGGRAR